MAWTGPAQAASTRKVLKLRHLTGHNHMSESSLYFVDRKNYAQVASAIASSDKEIILSTISLQHAQSLHSNEQLLDMFRNFAHYLHKCGRLENSIMISYDAATCQALLSSGILCFVDRAAPRPRSLPGVGLNAYVTI